MSRRAVEPPDAPHGNGGVNHQAPFVTKVVWSGGAEHYPDQLFCPWDPPRFSQRHVEMTPTPTTPGSTT